MRRTAAWPTVLVLSAFGWMGCGGGSGSSSSATSHPPALSSLSVSPAAVYQGSGGGSTNVTATFQFTDTGGDLNSLSLQILDASGTTLQSASLPITGAEGVTAGTLTGQATVTTTLAARYTFRLVASDRQASTSNTLTGTFLVGTHPVSALAVMPTPRARVAAAALGGLLYTIGGGDAYGNAFATVETLDPATGLWSTRPSLATPRDGPVAAVLGSRLYVAAGGLSHMTEVYDPATGLWSSVAPMPTERNGATGCELGGRLYVVGGNQGMDLSTVEAYDPTSNTWIACAPLPVARSWAGACAVNGKLYVVGGYASTAPISPWLDRLDIYDPATDSWSSGPPIPLFPGLFQHVVLALNDQVVVLGGGNAERALDTIYRFDPATGTWTQGARLPRPLAQFGGVAASGLGYLFDGSGTLLYDPSRDLGPLP